MQSQGQHDNSMRGFNGYMPSQGMYNMQQPGQVPNMNHRPGGMQMPQTVRSHSNPNLAGSQDNHYMTTPPQMQRSVTSPYGGPLPSPMGMGGMGGYNQGMNEMMGGGLPPAHGGMSHNSQQQGMNMNSHGSGGGGFQSAIAHQSGRNEYGMQSDNSHYPQHMQHQRYASMSQNMGGNRDEPEFNIQVEDFPALPGSATKTTQNDDNESSMMSSHISPNPPVSLRLDVSPPSMVPLSPSVKVPSQLESSGPSKNVQSRSEDERKHGLMGLLDIIKAKNRDLNLLALGYDLTKFGLNMSSSECLYSTFNSPFAPQTEGAEPKYTTPSCYRMNPPTLKAEHSSKFQVETLFYMFYAMPKDLLQATAAQELYKRDWRYHGELRLWLKARTQQEVMQSHSNVQYVYFDVNMWEARLFTNSPVKGNISSGFLSDDDVAVKQGNMVQPVSSQQSQQQQMGQKQQHGVGSSPRTGNGVNA